MSHIRQAILGCLLLFMALRPAWSFTDAIWTNPPAIYTNILGREFCQETILRDRWSGGTGYNFTVTVPVVNEFSNYTTSITFTNGTNSFMRGYTSSVPIVTNIVVTNIFGDSFETEAGTGVVAWSAAKADELTREVEGLLPFYVLPCYADTNDYSFDAWWSNGLSWWPQGSHYDSSGKADAVAKYDLGYVTWTDGPNVWDGGITNWFGSVGIVQGNGHWIKRKNRIDPLVVAEWRRYNDSFVYMGYVIPMDWEYFRGFPNEFTDGSTQLFGIAATNYPVFVIHPGGSNSYTSGLSLQMSDAVVYEIPIWSWYVFIYEAPFPYSTYWSSNQLQVTEYGPGWDGGIITLSSATQQSSRAWVSLGAPLRLVGTPPNQYSYTNYVYTNISGVATALMKSIELKSSDTVSLQYTRPMNTYEGIRVWDNILLPEQLIAHYDLISRMFLTPWTNWGWTNSIQYAGTNSYVGTSTPHYDTGYYTNAQYTPATPRPEEVLSWWNDFVPGVVPHITNECFSPIYGNVTTSEVAVAPYAYTSIVSTGSDWQIYYGFLTNNYPDGFYPDNLFAWTAKATNDLAITGCWEAVTSDMQVNGLYTGTPHRVHVYALYRIYGTNENMYLHRVVLGDWTSAASVVIPYRDLRFLDDLCITGRYTHVADNGIRYAVLVQEPYAIESTRVTDGTAFYNQVRKDTLATPEFVHPYTNPPTMVQSWSEGAGWPEPTTNWYRWVTYPSTRAAYGAITTNIVSSNKMTMTSWTYIKGDGTPFSPPQPYAFPGFASSNAVTLTNFAFYSYTNFSDIGDYVLASIYEFPAISGITNSWSSWEYPVGYHTVTDTSVWWWRDDYNVWSGYPTKAGPCYDVWVPDAKLPETNTWDGVYGNFMYSNSISFPSATFSNGSSVKVLIEWQK